MGISFLKTVFMGLVWNQLIFLALFLFNTRVKIDAHLVANQNSTKKLVDNWDNLARTKFYPMAAAAYAESPTECLNNVFKNATLQKSVNVRCGEEVHEPENCFGFTALLHDDKAIMMSFRGTNGLVQLIYEGEHLFLGETVNSPLGGKVGEYFYNIYVSLMEAGLRQSLQVMLLTYPDYELWVTGHSLGGSLASIAAGELVGVSKLPANRIKLITFGQPRTGDSVYAKIHDYLVPESYRIVHARDIVPHIPGRFFKNYHHHMSEIWYKHRMGKHDPYDKCKDEETDSCSDGSWLNISIFDHLFYYNKMTSTYGVNGCKN